MVTLFVTSGCTSCRKAKKWLQENEIPFIERNIFVKSITLPEMKEILQLTDNGTEDIIATRSKTFQRSNIDMEQLTLTELFRFIQVNPGILRSPILHDGKKLMVGYNQSQIRRFLPRSERTSLLKEAQKVLLTNM